MPNDERNLETLPDGALGLIPLESCKELGLKVDKYLVGWREKRQHQHASDLAFKDYRRDSYIISTAVPRFGTGEAKGDKRVCPWIRPVPDGRCDKLQSYLLRMRP